MSDEQTTEVETPDEKTTQDRVPDATPDEQPEQSRGNKEAAKYRTRLRETEAERDHLATQVENLRRASVEDRLKTHRVPAAGFWASGVQLQDLLDEDGNLDDEAIKTAAETAVETLGLERAGARGPYVPKEGNVTNPRGNRSWEDAFRPH